MKELSKISFRFLIGNKKRTIFSILGTMLSVILITSIVLLLDSYTAYKEKFNLYQNGSWLIKESTPSETNLSEAISLSPIKDTLVVSDMGVSPLSNNTYIEILGYSDFNEIYPFHLIDGRKPENENEIAVPEEYIKEKKASLNDQLELSVGNRFIQEESKIRLVNDYADLMENEYFEQETIKSYRIVGVYKDISLFKSATALKYRFVTKSSQSSSIYTTYYTIQNINEDQWDEIVSNISPEDMYCVNESAINLYVDKMIQLSIEEIVAYGLIILLIGLNMIAFIKNIFDISLKERMRMLGTMECIGAAPNQIRTMVLLEAIMIGIIAIPIGIIVCTAILFILLNMMEIGLAINPLHLIIVILIVLVMLMVAAWLPTLKISHFSSIQLLRTGITENKQKRAQYKTYKKNIRIEKLIGMRNRKANKKAHRSIIFSLCMSIILFISGNYYINGTITSISQYQFDEEAIQVTFESARNKQQLDSSIETIDELFALNKDGQNEYSYQMLTNINIPESYWSSEAKEIFSEDELSFMNIEIISDGSISEGDKNKIEADVYNCVTYQKQNKDRFEVKLLDISENQEFSLPYSYIKDNEFLYSSLDFTVEHVNRQAKNDINSIYYEQNQRSPILAIHVSLEDFIQLYTQFDSQEMNIDVMQTIKMYNDAQDTLLKNIKEYEEAHINTIDSIYDSETDSVSSVFIVQRALCNIFSIFILSISIANILHTVISGILMKKKEIAVLQSVGMESKQAFYMIFYENISYVLKSLCIAIPISILLNYVIYRGLLLNLRTFDYPILYIIIAIVILLSIVVIASYFGWRRIYKESIIDKIRNIEL